MSLRRYLLRRLALTVVTLIGVVIVVVFVTRVLPGDPVLVEAGGHATPEVRAALSEDLGLDEPLPIQLGIHLRDAFRGDLVESVRSVQPVREDLFNRLPVTVELALASLLVGGLIGILLRIWAALRYGGRVDGIMHQVAIRGAAAPLYWIGLVLLYLFYHLWHIAPPPVGRLDTGILPPRDLTGLFIVDALVTGTWDTLQYAAAHVVLLTFALGFVVVSPFTKMARSAMLAVLAGAYVLAARSLGLSASRSRTRRCC